MTKKITFIYILILLPFFNFEALGQQVESTIDFVSSEKYCAPLWQDHIFGECMGRNNSLIAYDYDSDGVEEMIVNANVSENPRYGFWYILKYNSSTENYEKVYVSQLFDQQIIKMDISLIGEYPRLCIASVDNLYIYNLNSLELQNTIVLGESSWVFEVKDLKFTDINADNIDDILLNGSTWFKIIDGSSYDIVTNIEGSFTKFDIGNVDNDDNLEIVSTEGIIYDLTPQGNITEEYYFEIGFGNTIDIVLEDIDNDGKEEGILGFSSQRIEILDFDTGSIKYEIPLFFGVNTMNLRDVLGNSIKELVVTSFTDGVLIYDLVTGELLKSFDYDVNDIPSVVIADFDNDGLDELVHSSSCSSSTDDLLYFISLESGELEYQNIFVEGDFYGIEVADLDSDGTNELITMSGRNDIKGGTLSIYDAVTKVLKFRSDKEFFPESINDSKFIEVMDYGHDGDLDIVIAGGKGVDGKIWVVDGTSYTLEVDHLFAPEIDDIDAMQKIQSTDGTEDILITAGSILYYVNGFNLHINWEIEMPGISSGLETQLLIHDLSNDGEKEIIVTDNRILIFNLDGELQLTSTYEGYNVSQVVEWGTGGVPTLISGTRNGEILVLDDSLNIIREYKIDNSEITNIVGADLNSDDKNELIIGTEEYLSFLTSEGRLFINPVGKNIGWFDGLKYLDYDNDGSEDLIVGSVNNVMEIDLTCVECLFTQNEISVNNPTCGFDNGSIEVIGSNGYINMTIDGLVFNGISDSLKEGSFDIVIEDIEGCIHSYSIELFDELLNVEGIENDITCPGYADGEFYINVISGKPDYTFTVFDSIVDDTITNLDEGLYKLIIKDDNNCIDSLSFYINERPLPPFVISTQNDDPDTDELEGVITIFATDYFFLWEDGSTESVLDSLGNGDYSVTLTDSHGCEIDTTIRLEAVNNINGVIGLEINVYPNPARDIVYIDMLDGSLTQINMVSTTGEAIPLPPFIESGENQYQLDVSNVTSGIYYLFIKQNGKSNYVKRYFLKL